MNLARLNDSTIDHDKNGDLLRLLSESFGFNALMADFNRKDYDSIFALLKSAIETRKGRGEQEVSAPAPAPAPVPAARFARNVPRN